MKKELTKMQSAVLAAVVRLSKKDHCPSQRELAKFLKTSRTTVFDCLEVLKARKFLKVDKKKRTRNLIVK